MERALGTLFVMLGAAAMIAARRWNNTDNDAGYGIAGWATFVIVVIWL
jgi:hypothetical protein